MKFYQKTPLKVFILKIKLVQIKKHMKQTLNDLPSKRLPMGKVTIFLKRWKKIWQILQKI